MSGYFMSILLSLISLSSSGDLKTGFRYIDGSNNTYFIWGNEIKYTPISKENSSSGEYDGGEAKSIQIKKEESDKLYKLCSDAITDTTTHINHRNMGCGTLVHVQKSGNKTYYLSMNSKSKNKIENYLKELIK